MKQIVSRLPAWGKHPPFLYLNNRPDDSGPNRLNMNPIKFDGNTYFLFLLKALLIGVVCMAISPGHSKAQSHIMGRIVNGLDSPIAQANVLLLDSKDSSLVKGILSAEDGSFLFEHVPNVRYVVTSSYAGLRQVYSSTLIVGDNQEIDLGRMILNEISSGMKEVTVVAKRPLYEHKTDRLVINVQNSIASAGSTALDVLERSPGVLVDRENSSISIKGKEGVALMINGKMSYMPPAAAMELLQGMSSGTIDKIELITTPPSKYDAEGNAGYINIVLKANDRSGTNGSYSLTLGYGNGWVTNGNINFNHRKGKINLYGNFSYARVEKPLPVFLHTKFSNQGEILENIFNGGRVDTARNMNSRLGLDYQVSRKTVLGILVSGYDNKYTQSENNEMFLLKSNRADTIVKQSNSELNHWQSASANLNLQHDFREDSKLSINFDYIYYKNNQPAHYYSAYFDDAKNFLNDERKISTKSTPIHFWIGALDYSLRLGKKLTMETGIKGTLSKFYNDLGVEKLDQGQWILDKSLSAKYTLDENYSAIYASFDLAIDKASKAKLGLRYEYTNTNLGSEETKNIVDRHYGNLFPVITFSHAFGENSTLTLSYNMRITRPTFNNLAPYVYYINATTLFTGNPALQPTISNTVSADYVFKKYVLSLSYSKEDHTISIFQPKIDSAANKVVLGPQNLNNQKLVSGMLTVPVDVNDWWSMQYSFTGVWQQIVSQDYNPLKAGYFNVNLNAMESFRLPKGIGLEISGFYQSQRLEGIYTQKGYGSLNIGVRKKLAGRSGVLILSATNLLNSETTILKADYPERNLVTDLQIAFTQRTIKLTYTRSFGNNSLKERRERSTGAEDERGRVQ
jgi:hypothetical protein